MKSSVIDTFLLKLDNSLRWTGIPARVADQMSDGARMRIEPLGQRLIHDRYKLRILNVRFEDFPALQNRHAHGVKEPRPHSVRAKGGVAMLNSIENHIVVTAPSRAGAVLNH